jgi:WD40 repeat protein
VFAPDGSSLALAGADREIRRLSTQDLSPLGSPLIGHEGPVRSLMFSADGQHLYSGGQDRQVLDWDLRHPEALPRPLASHGAPVSALSPGQDAQHLTSAGEDDLLIWNGQTRQGLHSQRLPAPLDTAWALAWHPSGTQLAMADSRGRIRLLDPDHPDTAHTLPEAHTALVTRLIWRQQGHQLLSAGQDGRLLAWTPASSEPPQVLYRGGPLQDLAVAPDGDELAFIESPGRLLRRTDPRTPPAPLMPDHTWQSLSYSPHGHGLAAASQSGRIQTWLRDGQAGPSTQVDGPILQISWAGDTLLIATRQQGLLRWHPGPGKPQPLGQDKGLIQSLAPSPDGQLLAGMDPGGQVRLWDLASGQLLRDPLARHTGPGLALAWSPDGRRLVSSGWKNNILLHRTAASDWVQLACRMVQRNPPEGATHCDDVHSQ